jgi:tripartite-type tricarboxylate transporter receptor subunit TctC
MHAARSLLLLLICVVCPGLLAPAAAADKYPSRPVHWVVGFAAGGPNDIVARVLGEWLSAHLGQQFVIENRVGSGGMIAANAVINSPPDGYTIMFVAPNNAIGTTLYKSLPFVFLRDTAPVAGMMRLTNVMVVPPSLPVKTVGEFIAHAKANPGKLSYGAPTGIGPHFMMELFKRKVGIDIVHIPYRGSGPVVPDLISGQVHLTISGKSVLLPFTQGPDARVRPLAVTGPQRWSDLSDIPTLLEKSYLDVPYDTLFGIVAPAGTPAPVIAKLNAAINDGLRSSDMKVSFAKLGNDSVITTPAEFAAIIAKEGPLWAEAIRVTGIKPE